jgi:hypothetical protein
MKKMENGFSSRQMQQSVTQNKNLIKFNYTLHGYLLNSLEEVKSLGLTIRQDLKWKSCVNNICTRTNKTLGFLSNELRKGTSL